MHRASEPGAPIAGGRECPSRVLLGPDVREKPVRDSAPNNDGNGYPFEARISKVRGDSLIQEYEGSTPIGVYLTSHSTVDIHRHSCERAAVRPGEFPVLLKCSFEHINNRVSGITL